MTGRLGHDPQVDAIQGRSSLLDAGLLPVEDLAVLASREGRRPRPIYGAHRWFARRFGSAFRTLLTAAALPEGADFWTTYYEGTDYWHGKIVLDPFVGGQNCPFRRLSSPAGETNSTPRLSHSVRIREATREAKALRSAHARPNPGLRAGPSEPSTWVRTARPPPSGSAARPGRFELLGWTRRQG